MKKNFILLGILSLLLVITYFFQERRVIDEKAKKEAATTLFPNDLGEIKEIITPSFHLVKKDNFFWSKKNQMRIDPVKLGEVYKILGNIRFKRILDMTKVDRNHYFKSDDATMTFVFEKGKVQFLVGEKVNYEESFYVETRHGGKSNTVLAYDKSPIDGVYSEKSEHLLDARYRRLLSVFYMQENFLYDTHVFPSLVYGNDFQNFKKITIENKRSRTFSLDLNEKKTIPSIGSESQYNKANIENFKNELLRYQTEEVYPAYKKSELKKLMSTINLVSEKDKNYTLKLYTNWKGNDGAFVTSSDSNHLYRLKKDELRVFWTNVQDFWNTFIFKRDFFKTERKIAIRLQKTEKKNFYLKRDEYFNIRNQNDEDSTPLNKAYATILNFLINPASYIGEFIPKVHKYKNPLVVIEMEGEVFEYFHEDSKLIILNRDKKMLYHYNNMKSVPFSLKLEDYFL